MTRVAPLSLTIPDNYGDENMKEIEELLPPPPHRLLDEFLESLELSPPENPKDPFNALGPYGGMRGVGGLKPYTEYLVGIRRVFEELHCILGSLYKVSFELDDESYLPDVLAREIGHITEEFDLIERNMRDYSKDIYLMTPEIHGSGVYHKGYRKKTVEDLRENIPETLRRAQEGLRAATRSDLPYEAKELAISCYNMYIEMCKAIMPVVKKGYIHVEDNVFNDLGVYGAFRQLKNAVDAYVDAYSTKTI